MLEIQDENCSLNVNDITFCLIRVLKKNLNEEIHTTDVLTKSRNAGKAEQFNSTSWNLEDVSQTSADNIELSEIESPSFFYGVRNWMDVVSCDEI